MPLALFSDLHRSIVYKSGKFCSLTFGSKLIISLSHVPGTDLQLPTTSHIIRGGSVNLPERCSWASLLRTRRPRQACYTQALYQVQTWMIRKCILHDSDNVI